MHRALVAFHLRKILLTLCENNTIIVLSQVLLRGEGLLIGSAFASQLPVDSSMCLNGFQQSSRSRCTDRDADWHVMGF